MLYPSTEVRIPVWRKAKVVGREATPENRHPSLVIHCIWEQCISKRVIEKRKKSRGVLFVQCTSSANEGPTDCQYVKLTITHKWIKGTAGVFRLSEDDCQALLSVVEESRYGLLYRKWKRSYFSSSAVARAHSSLYYFHVSPCLLPLSPSPAGLIAMRLVAEELALLTFT